MGARAELDIVAVSRMIANKTETWTALKVAAEKAVEYWKNQAPVGKSEHLLMKGKPFIVRPEDYRDSIRWRMVHKDGQIFARVRAFDPKSGWVEFGSKHNPNPTAPCAQTRSYMLAEGFHG